MFLVLSPPILVRLSPQAIYKVFLSTCASPLALTLLYLYILLVWSLYVNLIDADPLIVMLPTRLSGPKVA